MASPPAARRAALARRRRARALGLALAAVVVGALGVLGSAAEPDGSPRPRAGSPPTLPDGCAEARPRARPPAPAPGPPDAPARGRGDLFARVATSCGDLLVDLAEDSAPLHVSNFVSLARRGFYDGLPFHRIEQNSIVQTGDPTGRSLDGRDGPGYAIPDAGELPARPRAYVYGVVAMATVGEKSAGSQFFVVVHDYEGALDGRPEPAGYRPDYPIIGRVDRPTWEVLERIARVETRGGNDPLTAVEPLLPVVVESIAITARG
jgi:cyclophilin family peptidyl-prolyl cis-trans isomerase